MRYVDLPLLFGPVTTRKLVKGLKKDKDDSSNDDANNAKNADRISR